MFQVVRVAIHTSEMLRFIERIILFALLPPALERREQRHFACPAESEGLSCHADAVWHPRNPNPPPAPLCRRNVLL